MPNQREIAKALGVTQATVSLALRRDPSIPERTCRLVSGMSEKMGYRPNPMVSALMRTIRQRKHPKDVVIALIATQASQRVLLHQKIIQGLRARAAQLGYRIDVFTASGLAGGAVPLSKVLTARGLRAMVFLPGLEDAFVRQLPLSQMVAVEIGHALHSHPVDRVASHHYQGTILAYQELKRKGFHRIGFLTSELLSQHLNRMQQAAFMVISGQLNTQAGPWLEVRPVGEWTKGIKHWLRREKPDAIIHSSPSSLCPDELRSIIPHSVCLANLSLNDPAKGPGIYFPREHMGAVVLDMVSARLEANQVGPEVYRHSLLIEGKWVDGP